MINNEISSQFIENISYIELKKLIDIIIPKKGILLGRKLYLRAKHDCKESFKTSKEWQIQMKKIIRNH